jgi:hypothetical protein
MTVSRYLAEGWLGGLSRRLSAAEAGWDRGRRLLVHDPCPPCRRGDASGLCDTVLITYGESRRARIGRTRNVVAPTFT